MEETSTWQECDEKQLLLNLGQIMITRQRAGLNLSLSLSLSLILYLRSVPSFSPSHSLSLSLLLPLKSLPPLSLSSFSPSLYLSLYLLLPLRSLSLSWERCRLETGCRYSSLYITPDNQVGEIKSTLFA